MNGTDEDTLRVVRDYHERTKHRPDRYAASPGYMDWANQPDPFRRFAGAERIDLPHPVLRETPTYDGLFSAAPGAESIGADFVARLFYHSLALSAWKQAPGTKPWSLRINPSSGDLHPTEGYLISGPIPGLFDDPGVLHYAPFQHQLERRCRFSVQEWNALTEAIPAPSLFIALTSIHWRESWKYGERAFRYCHHDVGHAIAAISFAALTLGWSTRLLEAVADDDVSRLVGAHRQTGVEAEHADCLLALFPAGSGKAAQALFGLSRDQWRKRIPNAVFAGEPNRLSRDHHPWPLIDEVSLATRHGSAEPATAQALSPLSRSGPQALMADRQHSAEQIIRQRRSAVDMDGSTWLDRTGFYQMLQRTLPVQLPFRVLPWTPRVSLAVFVHRVEDLEPGLYLLVRDGSHEASLRNQLRPDFEWQVPDGCPGELGLYRLLSDDMRHTAKLISCYQEVAADGAFAIAMLAEFDVTLAVKGPGFYPRLFWETGLVGQVLYLEAEAAGLRGTGIGCFFDGLMHEVLGIADRSWQSLYHFTVGGPVDDPRLKTIPPYAHADSAG